jgi:hypothetical protein
MLVSASLATASVILAAPQARADVTYSFTWTSAVAPSGTVIPLSYLPPNTLTVTDTAVQSGQSQWSNPNTPQPWFPPTNCQVIGDQACQAAAGFVSATIGFGRRADLFSGVSAYSISFNSDGSLSGKINLSDNLGAANLDIGGSGNEWSGILSGFDFAGICEHSTCRVNGYWHGPAAAQVPTPSSLVLLAGAVAMIGLAKISRTPRATQSFTD